ncbi:MAG: hypothetical protein IT292_01345 [Deltaproteobacteria bacterium]|nr:hypothetical protein [Deltaproteobacteria bacterium]
MDDNWADVRAALPLIVTKKVPDVLISTKAIELIVLDGVPQYEPIAPTKPMLIANTQNNLFLNTADNKYYFLAAGRWFSASSLAGPWGSASDSLPDDFKNIPEDSAADRVLVSVPGTSEANDAMNFASIPDKATIDRSAATVNVVYEGKLQLAAIPTTSVQYVKNTAYNVFLVNDK